MLQHTRMKCVHAQALYQACMHTLIHMHSFPMILPYHFPFTFKEKFLGLTVSNIMPKLHSSNTVLEIGVVYGKWTQT